MRRQYAHRAPIGAVCEGSSMRLYRAHSCESFRLTMKTRDVGEPMKCLKIVNGSRHFVAQPQSELKSEVLIPYRYDCC